jgi:putative ABC transport system permease protein
VVGLLVAESALLVTVGATVGLGLFYLALTIAQPMIEARFGLHVGLAWPSLRDAAILALVVATASAAGVIPAYRAYRRALSDGLIARI